MDELNNWRCTYYLSPLNWMHETRIQKLKQKKKLNWKVFFHRNQENNRLIHSFINSRPIKLLIYTWSSWFYLTLPQGLSPGARRNINNLRYADDTILMAKSDEEIKNLLMKVKGKSEKAGLNLNIKKWRSWHLVPSLRGK